MGEDKITLDKDVFKALASETRISILKSLSRRRKTLTELSKELGMSFSTIKEHLDSLVAVGLIEQKDEGYKWKYYELTSKGKAILHPEDKRIWILIGISIIGAIFFSFEILRYYTSNFFASNLASSSQLLKESLEESAGAPSKLASPNEWASFLNLHVIGLIVCSITLLVGLAYLIKMRIKIYSEAV
jgi:DNA-binding transcriptional ArsR family regulator